MPTTDTKCCCSFIHWPRHLTSRHGPNQCTCPWNKRPNHISTLQMAIKTYDAYPQNQDQDIDPQQRNEDQIKTSALKTKTKTSTFKREAKHLPQDSRWIKTFKTKTKRSTPRHLTVIKTKTKTSTLNRETKTTNPRLKTRPRHLPQDIYYLPSRPRPIHLPSIGRPKQLLQDLRQDQDIYHLPSTPRPRHLPSTKRPKQLLQDWRQNQDTYLED